jgi:hypothetical protein
MNEKYILIMLIFLIVLLFYDLFSDNNIESFNNCTLGSCATGYILITNKCIPNSTTLSPLIKSYYDKSGPFVGTYSITPININVIDISNVDVQYGYYANNDSSKTILGYDSRRFTYTMTNNNPVITSCGLAASGITIKTPSPQTVLNSDGSVKHCNYGWILNSNKLDCQKCTSLDIVAVNQT